MMAPTVIVSKKQMAATIAQNNHTDVANAAKKNQELL
jgi:hypothetical protein